MKQVLITGATGKIGSLLIHKLAEKNGIRCSAFVRDETKARKILPEDTNIIFGDLEDPERVHEAMMGIDTIVLITPADPLAAVQAHNVLNAAVKAKVRKIVRVSVFKAAVEGPAAITRLHGETDKEIMRSGLVYTILRPGFFMQNLLFLSTSSIITENTLYFGTSESKLGMIDYRDIVDCIEQIVITGGYKNEIFTLTGPQSISFRQIAWKLSGILDRPIQYIPVTPETVKRSIKGKGLCEWYAEVMRELCIAYSANWGNVVTDHVLHLSGHEPRSFDQFAREIFIPEFRKYLHSSRA